MKKERIIVAGGGPAGLMAAGQAALAGAETILVEKMDRPALKLGITGKGRCNFANTADLSDTIFHFGKNGRFLRQAFSGFFMPELVNFFEHLGVPVSVERGGRIFPSSSRALDIVTSLVKWVERNGVKVFPRSQVTQVVTEKGRVTAIQVKVKSNDLSIRSQRYHTHNLILATGGASYPATGSTGDGYGLAASVGHGVVPIRPALVPLETEKSSIEGLEGLTLKNVVVKLLVNRKKKTHVFGEIAFTRCGISGPLGLSLSKQVVAALHRGDHVAFSIDLKPALDEKKLDARLLRDLNSHGKGLFRILLKGLLPAALIPVCIRMTQIPGERACNQVTGEDRRRLRRWLKDFQITITGHCSFDEAIITAGGVDTREIDPRTMESRLIKGLYFAGEILDLDADTGGFNLQAAFSTGWLAGRSAAMK